MGWETIVAAAISIISAVIEHNRKIAMTHNISSEISKIARQMEEFIVKFALAELQGKFSAYSDMFAQEIRKNQEGYNNERDFEELADKLEEISGIISKYHNIADNDTYLEIFYPLHQTVSMLLIALRNEMKERFNFYLADELILMGCLPEMMESHLNAEKIYYNKCKSLHISLQSGINSKEYNYFNENFVKYRKELERLRYVYFHNLNCDFHYKDTNNKTAFGGFAFYNCSFYGIKEVEGRRVLAVNNGGGAESPTTSGFFKTLKGLPANTEIYLEMELLSQQQPVRFMHLVIREVLTNNNELISESAQFFNNTTGSWETVTHNYRKKREDTIIMCGLTWYDKEPQDTLIRHTFIEVSPLPLPLPKVEFNEQLSILHNVGWESSCSNMGIKIVIEDDVLTTQYLVADDRKKISKTPSIYNDLGFWASSWKVVEFEVYIKTRIPMDRKVQLVIYELDNDLKTQTETGSGMLIVSDEWTKLSVLCKRKLPKCVLRCQIYWYDNEPVELIIRDAKIIYHENK